MEAVTKQGTENTADIEKKKRKKKVRAVNKVFISDVALKRIEDKLGSEPMTTVGEVLSRIVLSIEDRDLDRDIDVCNGISSFRLKIRDPKIRAALLEMLENTNEPAQN